MTIRPKIVENDPYLKPYSDIIERRFHKALDKAIELCGSELRLIDFANGHHYYGLHRDKNQWYVREHAPNATAIYLVGDFSHWQELPEYQLIRINDYGDWQQTFPIDKLEHGQLYKLSIHWNGGKGLRLPSYTRVAIQDPQTKLFAAQVWAPLKPYRWKNSKGPKITYTIIYEAHVGMATEEERVGTFREFADQRIPEIAKAGYNVVQLMAIMEHPYYGSFGYHVSNFFAVSSRFGNPDDLKYLVDKAHQYGLAVIMDLVHSHSVKNTEEGLGEFDGSRTLYFHDGPRREHIAWDSLCFDYGKNNVLHFLLSNCKYWLEEYRFDGFRFDGVTSMLYYDHGLGANFVNYDMYYNGNQDEDAIVYLTLANMLIHQVNPNAITIAEDMSGMPGLAIPFYDGGMGFDYRLAMGIPDYWIKIIKELSDEQWHVGDIYYQLTNKRLEEKVVSYAESHDQALVGDKTIIFRLIDAEMYTHMSKLTQSLIVDRGIALHKMIRLITFACSAGGYLNFMGNEFGHPEWIDFPRQGNNWSYWYARRQWSLRDDKLLKYHYLADFDQAMIELFTKNQALAGFYTYKVFEHIEHQILAFKRKNLLLIFNFSPTRSVVDFPIEAEPGEYDLALNTDSVNFGGFGLIKEPQTYFTLPVTLSDQRKTFGVMVYMPPRTAIVLQKKE
ncbi:MAG TPA: alpha amylase C-terminal domain-containing protein [Salinivirgaceae bacterium]|nr:alpha amylase C-terminal domain-containing protein [Salinivirgaceae bacterium]